MPSDPRDYKLDLSTAPATTSGGLSAPLGRPFLSVHFACCAAYQRIYRDADGSQYQGRCPRCGKAVRFVVGEGGTTVRTFTVS
jgi:PHP family Zn ribbon phosphoesterase